MYIRSKSLTFLTIFLLAVPFLLTTGFSFVTFLQQTPPVTSSGTVLTDAPFSDTYGNWAEAAIAEMYAKDVMKGYEDATFKPKKPITFLEAVVLVDKLRWGRPPVDTDDSNSYLHDQFNIPQWAVQYVASAMKNNLMMWNELQKAARQQPMTRQDAAILAVRALEISPQAKSKKGSALPFTDSDQIDASARAFVALAYERRVIDGYPDGTFQPANPISRAEMAVLLSNIAQQIPAVNAGEISGFLTAVNLLSNSVTLTKGNSQELQFALPENTLIYLNDRPSTISRLALGNHVRIITGDPAKTTIVLAETVAPDNGIDTPMEQVNPTVASIDIQQWVETNKISENYLYQVSENSMYFLATRGEKMYSGYSVEIKKVSATVDNEGIHYRVWLDRSDPNQGTVKLPVISYPIALVRIAQPDKSITSVTFVDQLNQVIAEVKE